MQSQDSRALYLDLMEKCLVGLIYEDPPQDPWTGRQFRSALRQQGRDWPSMAHTMIGAARLHNLRDLCERVVREEIPGDFIETGIWRGGACILMRAVLKAYGLKDRRVWCADSFEGLPRPDPVHYPHDAGDQHASYAELSISLDEVRGNFEKYGLLDDQVRFLKGWFKDTLPNAPVAQLAIVRLDGDMYQSTMEALSALYPKLSSGGYLIVDDWGAVPACRQAIEDYRKAHAITDEMTRVDWTGVYWRKS